MPYSHSILDSEGNEQLQRRFGTRIDLESFRYETSSQQNDFRKFLRVIDDKLPLAESSNISDPDTALCIFEATQGVVAHVMKLIRRASAIALEEGGKKLTQDILALAYEQRLAAHYPDKSNPFGDVLLMT
jgi:hypothetical protein